MVNYLFVLLKTDQSQHFWILVNLDTCAKIIKAEAITRFLNIIRPAGAILTFIKTNLDVASCSYHEVYQDVFGESMAHGYCWILRACIMRRVRPCTDGSRHHMRRMSWIARRASWSSANPSISSVASSMRCLLVS